jgi:uncharacterized protein YcbK (DUF882 family)
MIQNSEKLDKAIPEVKELVKFIFNWGEDHDMHDLVLTSIYRSPEENAKLKNASLTSLHLTGSAADFYFDNVNIFKIVTPLFLLFLSDVGVWKGTTQFEVCKAVSGVYV